MSTPYADTAAGYLAAGWSPLPLPAGRKNNPPAGWTGAGAPHPSGADVAEWAANGHGAGNVGLRARPDQVGLDVDQYDDKTGGDTLAKLEADLGHLPPTVVSSRRFATDPVSGIRWFRLPPGVTSHGWPNTVGASVEIIREGHRYAVAWPSTVDGLVYRWLDQTTGQLLDTPPAAAALPELPAPWLAYLAARRREETTTEAARYLTPGEPCRPVLAALETVTRAVEGGNRHDDTGPALMRLVRLGEQGHRGVDRAVADTRAAFVNAVSGDRQGGTLEAVTEYRRLLDGAAAKVTATPTAEHDRGCCDGPPVTLLDPRDADHTPGRRVRLTYADTIRPRRVRWLWDGRHALGTLDLIAGREGRGKSTVAYWKAARITRGELPGEYLGNPRVVLVAATEDSWEHTIVPRLMAAGADLTKVARVDTVLVDDLVVPISLPRDLGDLGGHVDDTGAALILLDPLMSRLDVSLDTHRDSEVRRALEPLVAIGHDHGAGITGIIHLNKGTSREVLDRVMGSKAFTAVARAVSVVVDDPEDESEQRRLFGTPKNNLGRTDLPSLSFTLDTAHLDVDGEHLTTSRVVWGADDTRTIRDAIAQAEDHDRDEATAVGQAAEQLLELVDAGGGKVFASDAMTAVRQAGHSERTAQRARRRARLHYHRTPTTPSRVVWFDPARWSHNDGDLKPAQSRQLSRGEGESGESGMSAGQSVAPAESGESSGATLATLASPDKPPAREACECGDTRTTTHPRLGTVCARCGNPRPEATA